LPGVILMNPQVMNSLVEKEFNLLKLSGFN